MATLRTDHQIDLGITTEPSGALAISGEIDVATTPSFARALVGAGERPVVVDLSAVTFMDSSGAVVLLEHVIRGDVSVRAVSPQVLRTLRIAAALQS